MKSPSFHTLYLDIWTVFLPRTTQQTLTVIGEVCSFFVLSVTSSDDVMPRL